jgi:type II secretory pathway pseudopilin PulG
MIALQSAIALAVLRRGIALMGALVALAILSMLITLIAGQMMAHRRVLEHRQYQLQATWLARAGFERAVSRILSDPAEYDGESTEIIRLSSVRIEVKKEDAVTGIYRVDVEARYPTDTKDSVKRLLRRRVQRRMDGEKFRLEILPDGDHADGRSPENARTTS